MLFKYLFLNFRYFKKFSEYLQKRKFITNYKPKATRDVGIRAEIILKSDKPVVSRLRRLAPSERKKVNDLMSVWVEKGIQLSNLEYASPIILVKTKKMARCQVCIDYRKLNQLILRLLVPLPLIEDQIDALAEGCISLYLISKMDFSILLSMRIV